MNLHNNYITVLLAVALLFGVAVSFAGIAVADDTVELEEGENYWMGQNIEYTDDTNDLQHEDTHLELQKVDGDDTEFVTELSAEDSDTLVIDTDGLDTETYVLIVEGDETDEEVEFDLRVQDLDITAEDHQVLNDDSDDSTTSFEVDSNRVGFYLNVTADGLEGEELEDIFGVSDAEDDTLEVHEDDLDSVDFEDIESSEYEFEFDVVDSNATSTAVVTVSEPGDAQASFSDSPFSAPAGDTGEITVELDETDSAIVTLGDEDDIGYEVVFEVEDDTDSDNATVQFNTYQAGHSDDVVTSEDDIVTVQSQTDFDSDHRLVAEQYDLTVEVEEGNDVRETDLAYFNVEERQTDSVDTSALPASNVVSSYDDVVNATGTDTVADGDYLVVGVEVTGVFGAFDEAGVSDASDLAEGTTLADDHGIFAEIEESEAGPNTAPVNVDLADADLYYDEDDGQVFFVYTVDEDSTDFELDNEYTAEFTVNEDNAYVDDEEDVAVVNTTFGVEEAETEFVGLNEDDELEFAESDEVVVEADTNLAEGTEDEFVVRLESGDDPTVDDYETTVENGTFSASVDVSSLTDGDVFTVELRGADVDETTATIVESDETEYDVDVVVEDADGNPVEADVTVDGETLTGEEVTFALVNGEYTVEANAIGYLSESVSVNVDGDSTSVTVTLEEEPDDVEEYTLDVNVVDESGEDVVADVTVDGETLTDSTVSFGVEEGEYTVSVSADGFEDGEETVTVDEDSETTVTLTETDEGETDDSVPGFGPIVAVLALVAAAVGAAVYTRQNN